MKKLIFIFALFLPVLAFGQTGISTITARLAANSCGLDVRAAP
jgi:hypothetical protein